MFMYLVTSLVRVAEVPGHVEVTAGFDRCSPFSPEADLKSDLTTYLIYCKAAFLLYKVSHLVLSLFLIDTDIEIFPGHAARRRRPDAVEEVEWEVPRPRELQPHVAVRPREEEQRPCN